MSATVFAFTMRSAFSRKWVFHSPIADMVSRKFSQTEQVQLAAVSPPAAIASKIGRPQSEMMSPSKTMRSSCSVVMWWSFGQR